MKANRHHSFVISIIYLILLASHPQSYAMTAEIERDPHHQGLLSTVNAGFRYSSILENRGVILYKGLQIDPVLALFFFDDRVEYLGDSIGFRDFVAGRWLRLRTRFVTQSDDPLFPEEESKKVGLPNRKTTYEWVNRAEFFIPGYDKNYLAEISVGHAKDLSVHQGNYLDVQAKLKLFRFRVPAAKILIEPNLYSSIGWGDASHNQYFYGPSQDSSGFNNFSYGLWFAFPEEADRFYPIIQIRHFRVLDSFATGEYSAGNSKGWLFSFIATVGVW